MAKALKAIDFFCGAGGMTYGLTKAGIEVVGGIDWDTSVKATYLANNPKSTFLHADVRQLRPEVIAKQFKIKKNQDNLIFVGCSPCQYWSKIGTNKTKSKESAFLLREFFRFIKHFRPGYIVIENVPGLLTSQESYLPNFLRQIALLGYVAKSEIKNAADYGVPQSRKRFLLLATRLDRDLELPEPKKNVRTSVRDYIGTWNGFPKVSAGNKDSSHFLHSVATLSQLNLKRVKRTPKNGGSRKSWSGSSALQLEAYKRNPDSFSDAYSRMYWDKPSPTITTRFNSVSNGRFIHPVEDRGLSLREGAALQTFPIFYKFFGTGLGSIARQIGNAVPPMLAQTIGKSLRLHFKSLDL